MSIYLPISVNISIPIKSTHKVGDNRDRPIYLKKKVQIGVFIDQSLVHWNRPQAFTTAVSIKSRSKTREEKGLIGVGIQWNGPASQS